MYILLWVSFMFNTLVALMGALSVKSSLVAIIIIIALSVWFTFGLFALIKYGKKWDLISGEFDE